MTARKKVTKKKVANKKAPRKETAGDGSTQARDTIARFFDSDYLDHEPLVQPGVQRAVLFALVELRPGESLEVAPGEHLLTHPRRREFLLTSRVLLFDVVFDDGSSRSLLAGYVGGGSFQRLHFAEGRVVRDFAHGMSLGDEESIRGAQLAATKEEAFYRLFNSDPVLECWVNEPPSPLPTIAANHTAGVLRIADPALLKQDKHDDDLGVLYKVWTAPKFDLEVAQADPERLKKMVSLAGLTVSISDEVRPGPFEPICPTHGDTDAANGDTEAEGEIAIGAAFSDLGACDASDRDRLCERLLADLGRFSIELRWSITQLRSAHVLLTQESSEDDEDYHLFFDYGEASATLPMEECSSALSCLDVNHWVSEEAGPLSDTHPYKREIVGLPSLPDGISLELDADSGLVPVAVYDAEDELQPGFFDLGEGYESDCYVRCGNGVASLNLAAADGRHVNALPGSLRFEGLRRFLTWYSRGEKLTWGLPAGNYNMSANAFRAAVGFALALGTPRR